LAIFERFLYSGFIVSDSQMLFRDSGNPMCLAYCLAHSDARFLPVPHRRVRFSSHHPLLHHTEAVLRRFSVAGWLATHSWPPPMRRRQVKANNRASGSTDSDGDSDEDDSDDDEDVDVDNDDQSSDDDGAVASEEMLLTSLPLWSDSIVIGSDALRLAATRLESLADLTSVFQCGYAMQRDRMHTLNKQKQSSSVLPRSSVDSMAVRKPASASGSTGARSGKTPAVGTSAAAAVAASVSMAQDWPPLHDTSCPIASPDALTDEAAELWNMWNHYPDSVSAALALRLTESFAWTSRNLSRAVRTVDTRSTIDQQMLFTSLRLLRILAQVAILLFDQLCFRHNFRHMVLGFVVFFFSSNGLFPFLFCLFYG
jgi:hypothetical protein